MKVKSIFFIGLCLCCIAISAFANEENEKMYLIQMLNQLDALKPLVIAASEEQVKNTRVKFHYTSFMNSSGKPQNGLLDDINEIEKGIHARINQTDVAPHKFDAINGDYINDHKLKLESQYGN
jgi:RAQPRD family integrative conjugative element protein